MDVPTSRTTECCTRAHGQCVALVQTCAGEVALEQVQSPTRIKTFAGRVQRRLGPTHIATNPTFTLHLRVACLSHCRKAVVGLLLSTTVVMVHKHSIPVAAMGQCKPHHTEH